ncbi:hypothetical protein RA307_30535 [Xanthobacteraceae bacterium Astr-EGSB]|uniref:hypothetical protein n=1 Tax=Astrobacterium formosum TaxID=3069710 RepID=UPI0027B1DBD5|nr:hypothetical protein [Xanthobacteraceae bacterium Astr-EGSB]
MIGALETAPSAQLTFPMIVEAERAAQFAAAKVDPRGHRGTLVFEKCASPALDYAGIEIPVRGGRGFVRFGWTKQPNAAGYHLIFRETTIRYRRVPARTVREVVDSTIRKSEAPVTCRRLAAAYSTALEARRKS